MKPAAKRLLIQLLKLGVSLGLVYYLLYTNWESILEVRNSSPRWGLLAAALGLIFCGVFLTIVRWYWLVRALELPFTLRDAMRLGFLGYMLNFVSLGSVGGDLFKAIFIAREQPNRKTEAISTIVVDRIVGLFGLLLVCSVAVLLSDLSPFDAKVQTLGTITLVVTSGMFVVYLTILLPGCSYGPVSMFLSGLPKVGGIIRNLLRAARTFRRRRDVLLLAVLITCLIHGLNILGFYCMARALSDAAPPLSIHYVIIPLALLSSALPLPGMALGAFDMVINELYRMVSGIPGQGLLVAIAYRVMTILIALIGVAYYLGHRREVATLLHEAEEETEKEEHAEATTGADPEESVQP